MILAEAPKHLCNANPTEASFTDISNSATPRSMASVHVFLSFTACLRSAALLIQLDVWFFHLLLSFAPQQAPLICLTPLSDHAQQGVRVSTYWVHSCCQVLKQARQPCQGQ